MVNKVILNVDGASRGNPGPAAIGVTIKDENHSLSHTISEKIGATTNNQAEYRALIAGLKKAISLGAKQCGKFGFRVDGQTVAGKLQGEEGRAKAAPCRSQETGWLSAGVSR